MDYQSIIQDLSEHVRRFDCMAGKKGGQKILQINRWLGGKALGVFRRQDGWEKVGEICQSGKGPATLVNVVSSAPSYIRLLEGEEQESMPVLLQAIRFEAFRHEAKEVFKKYLSREIEQLEDEIKQLEG